MASDGPWVLAPDVLGQDGQSPNLYTDLEYTTCLHLLFPV